MSDPTEACAACGAKAWRPAFEKGGRHYARCTNCALLVAYPKPTLTELRELYHREYADPTGSGAALVAEPEMALATARWRLRAARRVATGERWLEVGCSTGAFLECATAEGLDIEGIDISDVAAEIARSHGMRVQAIALEELEPERPYDVVAAFDLIEHVPAPDRFLDAVRRVLRPRGFLVLTTPDTGSLTARLMQSSWYFYIPLVHIVHFDRANLARMLAAHGFDVLHQGVATKCLSCNYSVEQFAIGNPLVHRVAQALQRLLPARVRCGLFHLPIGEQFVVARARAV